MHKFSLSRQQLNAIQERELICWIKDFRSNGIEVSHIMVAYMVQGILDKSGDFTPLRKN
jgi:hypothetical protein